MIADREGWAIYRDATGLLASRKRAGRGGGLEYHLSLLPEAARKALAQVQPAKAELPDRESMLLRYERLPQSLKDEALRRLGFIQRVEQLARAGMTKTAALKETVAEAVRLAAVAGAKPEVSERTLHEWFGMIATVEPQDRVAYLAPRYAGRTAGADMPADAWEAYKAAYLRMEKPTHARCYREISRLADANGWTLPSPKSFERRIAREIPENVLILMREGPKAARHTFAAVDRSHEGLYPHRLANLDGHLWDVQVEWEDGTRGRPYCLAVQDIASGMPLAVRFDRTLNHHIVRLALGDTFRDFGLVERLLMDNGTENQAKEISGGIPRMRGKAVEEEYDGLLKTLGVEAIFATPYWGQAKPVERMFRNWAHDIAKSSVFAGAYCGHNAMVKPENHRSRAIPIAEFEAVIRQELEYYRDQLGRQGVGMNGRSFRQVYLEGVAAQWTGQTQDIDEDGGFPPSWVAADAPPPVPAGQTAVWISGEWKLRAQPMAPDLGKIRAAALGELADQRWRATQTFTYDGVIAPADPALGAVVGFVVGAQISAPTGPATWKLAAAEFRSWTVADVTDYGIAIRTHIQECFDMEAELAAEVEAATTPAAVAAIVDQARTGWPV